MNQLIEPQQVRALAEEEIVRGSFTWDLPESVLFAPGGTISGTVTITNPTDEARLYFIGWALIRNGEMIGFGGIEFEDVEDWVVEPGSSNEIPFELSPEFTDCYLNLSLLGGLSEEEEEDEVIEGIIDSLSTYLYSTPTVSPLTIQAQWVQYIIPGMITIGMIGTVLRSLSPTVKEVFKK